MRRLALMVLACAVPAMLLYWHIQLASATVSVSDPLQGGSPKPADGAPFPIDGRFGHDPAATFHPHGKVVCASGCAVSHHPTGVLTAEKFQRLLAQLERSPLDQHNPAFEELLFYGPQTSTRLKLDPAASAFLSSQTRLQLAQQLNRTHVAVSLRLVDQFGIQRAWLAPTHVPLDRRHVFQLSTQTLPELVCSGTAKRVGLRHVWVRL